MAKKILPNPDWIEAPYELAVLDKNGMRAMTRFEENLGPTRFIQDNGKFIEVPKFIEVEDANGTT